MRNLYRRIYEKVTAASVHRIRKYKAILFGAIITSKQLKQAVGVSSSNWETWLTEFLSRKSVIGFESVLPDRVFKQKILEEADAIAGGRVTLHGYEYIFNRVPDWHTDPRKGYSWDNHKHFSRIPIREGIGADIKFPWDLSRCHHIVRLAQAYHLTGDKKYSDVAIEHLDDWIEKNPWQFGVNWMCTMDVALRVVNWSIAFELLRPALKADKGFVEKFLRSVLAHADHISANLEKSPSFSNNHYIADLLGLLAVGTVFNVFKKAPQWSQFALRELEQESILQVYDDGCLFEASTYYHCFTLEMFLLAIIFAERGRMTFDNIFSEKIRGMLKVVLSLRKPDGTIPQIGDNDSGKALDFGSDIMVRPMSLLNTGALVFNDPKFLCTEFQITPNEYWLFGESGRLKYDSLVVEAGALPTRPGMLSIFRNAGWIVIQTNHVYAFLCAAPNGSFGRGGHSHNDKLSLELSCETANVLSDAGSYCYTSDPIARNYFRGTQAHSTLMVDRAEQNPFDNNDLFYLPDNSRAKIGSFSENSEKIEVEGEHFGYHSLASGEVTHKRKIQVSKTEARVTGEDSLEGAGVHTIDLYFHLAPGLDVTHQGSAAVDIGNNMRFSFDSSLKIEVVESSYSPHYGERVQRKSLHLYGSFLLPHSFQWSFNCGDVL